MLLALPQHEEGKGTPELIQRMSRKGEQAGETEKQVSNREYCCLLDTTFLTRDPSGLCGSPYYEQYGSTYFPSSHKLEVH